MFGLVPAIPKKLMMSGPYLTEEAVKHAVNAKERRDH